MPGTESHQVAVPGRDDVELRVVNDDAGLTAAAAAWRDIAVIGIDTEFERTRTYFARPGIVQIGFANLVVIVDLTCPLDLTPLRELLTASGVIKVAHAAGEDVQLLEHLTGARVAGIFDTQTAAALAGLGPGLGFHALVDKLLGIDLPKDQTRSDWLARPLAQAQLEYAALDAALLLPLHTALEARLAALERQAWVAQDCDRAMTVARRALEPEHVWERLRGLERLPHSAQYRAAALATWREQTARREDMPRGHLLKDNALLAVARRGGLSIEDLRQIEDLHPRVLRRFGEQLIAAHREAGRKARGMADKPALRPAVPRDAAADMSRALKAEVADVAAGLGLEPEIVASRRDLERLVSAALAGGDPLGADWPPALEGWRQEALQSRLAPLLRDTET